MPRTGHGGKREGGANTSYSQRTDLNAHVPVVTAPNQPYGEAALQKTAQNTIPMAPTQVTPQAAKPLVPLAPAQQRPTTAPGELPFLDATQRPSEPVTTGLDFGPGAGSEIMNTSTAPTRPLTAAMDEMASSPNASGALSNLAESARSLGL